MIRAKYFPDFSAARLIFTIFMFFAAVYSFAREVPQPEFKAKLFSNGVLYTFTMPADVEIKYKLFEPASGSYAEGKTEAGQSIFILNGITGAAWTETAEGKSLPVVLYPQAELPFADIDSAFISPAEGSWANKQPLVIDIPADYEAYYSLTSTDPLVSGLAYDGPVFIDMTGTVTVYIALVAPNGTQFSKSITYTVADYAAFQPLSSSKPVIYCGPKDPVSIPPSMKYYFGNSEEALQSGAEISSGRQSDILRYVPLVIEDRGDKYRYVLQTGGQSGEVKAIPPVNGIEFYEWNYFSFSIGTQVRYSVDGSPWQVYTNPVYIDRTKMHTIAWSSPAYKHGQVQALQLPPKPYLEGIPESGVTNTPVTLSISDKDFVLRHETAKHKSDFLHSMLFDVLPGEQYTFNTDLAVYYNGIRQGTLAARFTIDRQPTLPPVLSANAQTYSRKPVELNFKSNNEVFIRILQKDTDLKTGKNPDFSVFSQPDTTEEFIPLAENRLTLDGKEKSAVLYRVEAYSKNRAGNKSSVISYEVCVNTYSIFVSPSGQISDAGSGSPIDPLLSFAEAVSQSQMQNFAKIIISGTYEELAGFTVSNECEIISDPALQAVLNFSQNAAISVKTGASLSIKSIKLLQQTPKTVNQTLVSRSFFDVQKASLTLEGCTAEFAGNDSRAVIYAYDSAVSVKNSQLSVSAISYCAVVDSVDSVITFESAKISGQASAAELFTLSGGSFNLNKSDCTVLSEVGRIAGLTNVSYAVAANVFIKSGGSEKTLQNAIQVTANCRERLYESNTVSGFTSGILRIR